MDIGRKLAELEARLARVEGSPRLSHAALDNANIVVKDDTGTVRGRIGMQADGTIGLIAVDGPAPGAPTAPIVTSTIGGLRVVWDGTLADGSTLPADFDHVAVHVSTTTGFTPSAATYVGTITKAGDGGMLPVIPLPYVAHYVQLTAVNTSGNTGTPSAETAATPIKVDGPDLEAGSVTAATIEAGAVTAEKLEAVLQLVTRLVAGDPAGARVELNENGLRVYNSSGELAIRFDAADGSGVFTGTITGSTVTGGLIQTALSGARVTINESNENKILVYDAQTATPIGELSERGLLLEGDNGSVIWLDPDADYPNLRFMNSDQTNSAYINISSSDAKLGTNSGTFTGSGYTDMKWRTYMGGDFAVMERVRHSNVQYPIGGRIDLRSTYGTFGFVNSDTPTQNCTLTFFANLADVSGGRLRVFPPASGDSAIYLAAASAHTGPLLRLYRDADKFSVDKDGNTVVGGKLSAANIASGRITITPSAANTPTSMNVTGLNITGTPRVSVSANTSLPGTQVTGVGFTNVTTSGFTVWLTRTNTTSTGIDWTVIAE